MSDLLMKQSDPASNFAQLTWTLWTPEWLGPGVSWLWKVLSPWKRHKL